MANEAPAGAPELAELTVLNRAFALATDGWYQLAPFGEFPGVLEKAGGEREDVTQVIDREAARLVLAAFNALKGKAGFAGLLVDREHFSFARDGDTTAYAWLKDVEIRDDGIYGKLDLTDEGDRALKGGRYRFISPVFDVARLGGKRVRVAGFNEHSAAGFTNRHNLKTLKPLSNRGPAWGQENRNPTAAVNPVSQGGNMDRAAVCKALGLSADAPDAELFAAVIRNSQALATTKTELETARNRAATVERAALEKEADEFCDQYAGSITNRDQVRAQYIKDRDATKALFGAVKTAPAAKVLNRNEAKPPATGGGTVVNKGEQLRKQQEAIQTAKNKYGLKDFESAWSKASEENPELFAMARP